MQRLLASLLMVATSANAQVFVSPNQGGGEIVITSRPCIVKGKNYDQFREGYAWTPTVAKMDACWTIRDGNVAFIYLDDGEERIYPMSGFKEKK